MFRQLDPENTGFVEPARLKLGLNRLGSNLSDYEFSLVLESVNKKNANKIDVREFDKLLHQQVNFEDQKSIKSKLKDLHEHHRCSNSLKSNEVTFILKK